MYFWDNDGNAEYWARKKLREVNRANKPKYFKILICKANILLNGKLLDLTDENQIKFLQKIWREYCNKNNVEERRQFSGTVLNTLRQFMPEFFDEMKVTKGVGDYSNWEKRLMGSIFGRNTKLDERPKTFYVVHCISKVVNHDYHDEIKRN